MTKVLIIGAGSIGERHVRAFRDIEGVEVSVVDSREPRAQRIAGQYRCTEWFTDLATVPLSRFSAAVIATPADSHIPIANLCAAAGLHLLIEKPLAIRLDGLENLMATCEAKNLVAAVGYVLRFHPTVIKIRELLLGGILGRLLSVHVTCTHYLPDSRPDYRETYYGSSNAGAGVILDLSHELNYAEWLFGPLRIEACRRTFVADLGIPDEATADISLRSPTGLLARIHLNATDRNIRRECHVVGSHAELTGDLLTGTILVSGAANATTRFECLSDRDAWHADQAREFLDAIRGKCQPRCSVQEAVHTLRVSMEAMNSPMLREPS
jgi:predicted dehydrogenase